MRLEHSGYEIAAKTFDITQNGASTAAPVEPKSGVTDTIADDTSTTTTITVDGDHINSAIDAIGDQDFVKVELVEGQVYDIGMYASATGPLPTPNADAYLEIYDDEGNLIGNADGGGPNTPEGLDALMTFQATYSGTYYINARAFDQDGTNGNDGDGIGNYDLFVQTSTAHPYVPYYTADQPMSSIDWGTQVDGTSRNPDGDQGPRHNGEHYDPVKAEFGYEGKNVITYYLAKQGDVFVDEDPTTPGSTETMVALGWQDWEAADLRSSLDQYEKVADVVYVQVDNRDDADFKFLTYKGTPGAGASLLGRMSPPGTDNEGQAEFNANDERWTQENLQRGGFFYTTFLHEIGHGHGMAHPHDNGGHSTVMPGADGGTGGIGGGYGYPEDGSLSQQVYTVMSYNAGWALCPYGQPDSGGDGMGADPYGWMASLGALDIAVIQDKYGVNEDFHSGNDVYRLVDDNIAGQTFYECLWDAGGKDTIAYDGARDANIDLRAATLKYEPGGAGWMSYVWDVYAGYTIANGTTIENASSGAGDDVLRGNTARNELSGGVGNDVLFGAGGNDLLEGGGGRDFVRGGSGDDRLIDGAGKDVLIGGKDADTFVFGDIQRDRIRDLDNGDTISLNKIDADSIHGGNQDFTLVMEFSHTAGEALLAYNADRNLTRLQLDTDGDGKADMVLLMNGDHTDFTGFTGFVH